MPRTATVPSKDLTPADAYGMAFLVLSRLQEKVETTPGLGARGGIVLPNRRTGVLTPAHVLDLENNLLAELGTIKALVGITTRAVVPPLIHGRTPSDTVDLLVRALELVNAL